MESMRWLHKGEIKGVYSRGLEVLAFSLIELSIVLIIIGLLVAGVTGGKSLIDSARSRALINELREYERAVWTFRAARDRFPGDVMNYGTFGYWSNYDNKSDAIKPNYVYQKSDFSAPFNTGSFTPNYNSAPFVDLYTEGIIDFKPLGNSETVDKNSTTKGVPNSKVIDTNNVYIRYFYTGKGSYLNQSLQGSLWGYYGIGNFGSIKEMLQYTFLNYSSSKTGMDPKMLKNVDLKIDDGEYWNGRFRGGCYSDVDNYDNVIKANKKCGNFYYAL